MKRFNNYKNEGKSSYVCRECENDIVVREGLSYSPADMARLTERGMPVNALNTGKAYIDGEENPSFDITTDRQRFVEIADLWEQHQNIRERARNAARAKARAKKSLTSE